MSGGWQEFDGWTARYLAGELGGDAFARLETTLRESQAHRARFLDHCRLAQECSEITDARGLPEAVGAVADEGPVVVAASSVSWWRRRAVGVAAVAALLLALGVPLVNSWLGGSSDDSVKTPTALSPEAEAIVARTALDLPPPGAVRVSLVDRRPPVFKLTAVAGTAAAWWVNQNQNTDWAPLAESMPVAEWLDRIDLRVVEPQSLPDLAADLQL